MDDFARWTMVCPITGSVFEEPVLADDGHTYSKSAMLKWIARYRDRGLPITSPLPPHEEITERLIPNEKKVTELLEYRAAREQAPNARRGAAEVAPVEGGAKSLEPVKSLVELVHIFSLLDGLRGMLAELLDGWQPPQIVVVGEESSGKSSVLERLMMTPLLPRDENICTRLPIHVRLRRSHQTLPPELEVYNVKTKTTERGPYVIAAQSGAADVSEEMRKIIEEEQGSLRGVSASRIIIVHIRSPDVPFLDLIDMPGLVTAPSGDEPADMASQTEAVVKTHMQSEHGSNSLYLAIVKATSRPNTSPAMKILHENKLYDKTFGVFTFCDALNTRTAPQLKRWVRNGDGSVVLEPYGW